MADPITWGTVAKLAPVALGAIGMGMDAAGGAQQSAAEREAMAGQGEALRGQNDRLLAGPGAMPGYTENVQGYGFSDPTTGQYAFTDGPASMPGGGHSALPPQQPQQPAAGDMRAEYEAYLQNYYAMNGAPTISQQPAMQQREYAGRETQPVQPAMSMYGLPIFFEDGSQEQPAFSTQEWRHR